ncbi:MAG: hypothetical protein AB8B99_11510 [Phormidesmis sp.]
MLESLLSVVLSLSLDFNESYLTQQNIIKEIISISGDANNLPIDLSNLVAQELPAVEKNGFVFEFLGCEETPNTDIPLTCDFLVENSRNTERTLILFAYFNRRYFSRVIDANGNQIFASRVTLGGYSDNQWTSSSFPSRVPLKGSVSFSQAPEGGIRIFDLGATTGQIGYSSGVFDVEFRFDR